MKSFADWTQDLAESIGPVEHHWETRKEAELKSMGSDAAIAPDWQNPGAPIPVPVPPTAPMLACEQCRGVGPDVGRCLGHNGTHFYLCDACCRSNNFMRIR